MQRVRVRRAILLDYRGSVLDQPQFIFPGRSARQCAELLGLRLCASIDCSIRESHTHIPAERFRPETNHFGNVSYKFSALRGRIVIRAMTLPDHHHVLFYREGSVWVVA